MLLCYSLTLTCSLWLPAVTSAAGTNRSIVPLLLWGKCDPGVLGVLEISACWGLCKREVCLGCLGAEHLCTVLKAILFHFLTSNVSFFSKVNLGLAFVTNKTVQVQAIQSQTWCCSPCFTLRHTSGVKAGLRGHVPVLAAGAVLHPTAGACIQLRAAHVASSSSNLSVVLALSSSCFKVQRCGKTVTSGSCVSWLLASAA